MRPRPLFWLFLSLLFFIAGFYMWRLADRWEAEKAAASATQGPEGKRSNQYSVFSVQYSAPKAQAGSLNTPPPPPSTLNSQPSTLNPFLYRLTNSSKTVGELARSEKAILLENALVDTEQSLALSIPDHLRAQGDHGSYIVQSREALNDAFRARLREVGAAIVSYIPNNAYLVRVSAVGAEQLKAHAQKVLPYEPYYKLRPSLLKLAVEQTPLPDNSVLNLLLFSDAREPTLADLKKLGAEVLSEESSRIGLVLRVRPPVRSLAALAGLPGVEIVEMFHGRILANDFSRVLLGVSSDTRVTTNYLGLTGSNVLVNVNDTGVDTNHPDLSPRVMIDSNTNYPPAGFDTNGHGTHVAGIIAGTGLKSDTVTNASGSIMPGIVGQFRGKANAAKLLSLSLYANDTYLQETAALTNAATVKDTLISNNSWTYAGNEYDLAAASYDAAVRDALPLITGSQPVLYVFPAGNAGALSGYHGGPNDNGTGGQADSVLSPATAKNVLTVGGSEMPRNITNKVVDRLMQTNAVWQPMTDSSDQVAGFSSRGNVGIGTEGDFGRFKPDVIAPSTFVVSTRSGQWDEKAYYSPTNYAFDFIPNLIVTSNSPFDSGIFVPNTAVQLIVSVTNTRPQMDLPVYVTSPTGATVVKTNRVSVPPDEALSPRNDFWGYTVSNNTAQQVTVDVVTELVTTNDYGNYFQVLSNLNNSLGTSPYYYRYESGTSMAAADASGTLALMQEFFEQRAHLTNSPALMKALLINGARSLGNAYNFQVKSSINLQGWGQIQLPNSVRAGLSNVSATVSSMFIFDQSPTNALATGQRHTRKISFSNPAAQQNLPLRITLVWTDPPGNPAAAIKLVNDLDLVVTNLENNTVFYGNDILANNDFNLSWNTNTPPNLDVVNNVENVYLKQPLGSNYSITVIGKRVNVNAVSGHTNDVVQDYALVVSSGNGEVTNALTLAPDLPTVSTTVPYVTVVTNMLPASTEAPTTGGTLLHQRVGASTPLLGTNMLALTNDANAVITAGMTNQWHFYVLSNDMDFTNAAFITFQPENLSVPRIGTRETTVDNATRIEPDIDLYVSTNPGLTNLDTNVLATADKSLGRGGTEAVVVSNAAPKAVYYVGVKSEDQMAAEYGFLGIFSQLPFGSNDEKGNPVLRLLPVPRTIPTGTPTLPQAAQIFGVNVKSTKIRRVVVTNSFTHDLPGNLLGNLNHSRKFVVLNNHTCATDPSGDCITNRFDYIYEDNGERDIPGARRTDGPGSLRDFVGDEGSGVWMLTMVNNFPAGTGRIDRAFIKLDKEVGNGALTPECVEANASRLHSIDVPAAASSMTICVLTNPLPLDLYIKLGSAPTPASFDYHFTVNPSGSCFSITPFDVPPLMAGRYFILISNPNDTEVCYLYSQDFAINPNLVSSIYTVTGGPTNILDDAVSYSTLLVTNHVPISALDVGLLINHPRISDLAITLISPKGTRILLFEDRGSLSTNGAGSLALTNDAPLTNLLAFYTNNFDTAPIGLYAPGAAFEGWNVLTNFVTVVPDFTDLCLSNHLLVLGDGVVSNTLPTTNSGNYRLTFKVSHAPYLEGMVGWWPFEEDPLLARALGTNVAPLAVDIFGDHNGLLCGNPRFTLGEVLEAYNGDGIGTSVQVPRCQDLDVGLGRGLSVEGWIKPASAVATIAGPFATRVSGALPWIDTGVDVVAGQQLNITAFGTVVYGPDPGETTDPNGVGPLNDGTMKSPITVYPGAIELSLIGKIGGTTNVGTGTAVPEGAPGKGAGFVGTNYSQFIAAGTSGRLFLGYNDADFHDNSGAFVVTIQVVTPAVAAPLAEWNDPTNLSPQGVQFWVGGLPGTNAPGSLWANLWDTNGQPHIIATTTNALTNGGWQHVALTYDARSLMARIYTNGQLAVAQAVSMTNFLPATFGDLYFGYHPARPPGTACFAGGLDEFSLYARALTDCEVQRIYSVTNRGKYSPDVLTCPVALSVQLPSLGLITNFYNGSTWTNGPHWGTNILDFAASTNPTPVIVRPLDPLDPAATNGLNAALDEFVLSALVTNSFNTLLHFTEDTNLAVLPIKFAPAPFVTTNFPPTLIFSNGFENATQGIWKVGSVLVGSSNNAIVGQRNWTVVTNTSFAPQTNYVAVVTNADLNATGSNWVALARGALECTLPTSPGHRYELTYNLRGPCAVGWWNGDVEPLSRRAVDLIGANHGAFINGATNASPGLVTAGSGKTLEFSGMINYTNNLATKIELGDPENLRFTNSFTIEGWIKPFTQTNTDIIALLPDEEAVTEQIFYRGDLRHCLDPYYLALEQSDPAGFALLFHIESENSRDCGLTVEAEGSLVANRWQHVAAVFETDVPWTNNPPWPTNQLRLYVDGVRLTNLVLHPSPEPATDALTGRHPFRDLDPAFSPGVAIGDRSRIIPTEPFRGDSELRSQPFRGQIDELSAYARALTDPEIAAIHDAGAAGKADLARPPVQSLAKARLLLDNVPMDLGYGDNATWTSRTIVFTALRTNEVLDLEGLLPGTELDQVLLTEIPEELNYLPEESLDALNGEDAYGVWRLEMWDTRAAPTNGAQLVQWQLNFRLVPTNPPPVIYLTHGQPYTNSLAADGIQYFVVNVPQWATLATNNLQFAYQYGTTNPFPVTVFYSQTNFPPAVTNTPLLGPVSSGTVVLATNGVPPLVIGQPYYLAVTNPNPVGVTFSLGVWFDIVTLTNCQPFSNFVAQAGIPRYFQFDVPTNGSPTDFQFGEVTFWLTAARSNLTVVLSQHLPLPDLSQHDYISDQPCTNDEVFMVLTNTTPFPIQTNRWYVGIFNSTATNVPFTVQACTTDTNFPVIIPLTNEVPYVAALTNAFVAPPGPPRFFFFQFTITNFVNKVLFELYGLSGDADLVLERDLPPGMAPYFEGSFRLGTTPEQIVLRRSFELPDLRGDWYLGVYNNEITNVAYTIRASLPNAANMLISAQPIQTVISSLPAPHGKLITWNGVVGERYTVQFATSLFPPPIVWTTVAIIVASTPCPAVEVPTLNAGFGFYRVLQGGPAATDEPTLTVRFVAGRIRVSWPIAFPGYTLQYSKSLLPPRWTDLTGVVPPVVPPVTIEGTEFVVYPNPAQGPYYQLFK